MKKIIAATAGVIALGFASSAMAASMVGTWEWNGYTINCAEGGAHGLSCKVAAGPSNVGMEMVESKMGMKDGAHVGRIKHPADGKSYNAMMKFDGDDKVVMTGATDDGAKASGTFMRKK